MALYRGLRRGDGMKVGSLIYHPGHKVYGIVIEAAKKFPYARPPVLWVRSRWFGGSNLLALRSTRWARADLLVHVGEAGIVPRP